MNLLSVHRADFFFILFFLGTNAFAQKDLTEVQKYSSICMMWGFLKYNHPAVMSGRFDWDKELIDHIGQIQSISTKKELSRFYLNWINDLGGVKEQKRPVRDTCLDGFGRDFDTLWMNNNLLFTKDLSRLLHYIYRNRGSGNSYYATYKFHLYYFDHELPYKGMVCPSAPFRLLTLFRFWNVINYFYPSKYLIGENWDTVLTEMIPVFLDANDTISYDLAMLELVSKINDSHAYFSTPYTFIYFGDRFTPFIVRIINDTAVVTKILSDSLAYLDDIRIGDAILQIDGKSVKEILQENLKYIPASNLPTKLRNAEILFLESRLDSSKILFERGGVEQSKVVHRYTHPKFLMSISEPPVYVINYPWKIIDDSILYINPTKISKEELKNLLSHLNTYKDLIVDMRYYSKEIGVDAISRAIHKERVQFAKYLIPCKRTAGKFHFFDTPFDRTGRDNKDYFKGRTLLLFNETTQSVGELSCMMLQSAENVISIGSQTAGADGSAEPIVLPGGYMTRFSGMGVYYSDGRHTQRIGIQPNIIVQPTIQSIRKNEDVVLEKAIDFIENKN